MRPQQPTIAIVSPYWGFWEGSAPGHDLRQERRALLDTMASWLSDEGYSVVGIDLLDDPEPDDSTLEAAASADLVLVIVTMAAPPTHTLPVLDATSAPVVVWALSLGAGTEGTMVSIVHDGATVGTPQLTNMMVRSQRPFSLVSGASDDSGARRRCRVAIESELLAVHLRTTVLARIGEPLPGYLSVDVDDAMLEASLGLQVRRINAEELRDAAARASQRSWSEQRAAMLASHEVDPELDEAAIEAAARFAVGLSELVDTHDIDAGALNCHVAEVRHDPILGVAPCFALGDQTTAGVPWTCTGDALTSIAMLVGRRLGGAAFYHEIESLDPESGIAVLANTGEHDLGWCRTGWRPRLRPNPWFATDERNGPISWFPLEAGPATLIAFTTTTAEPSGVRLITAVGEILPEALDRSPTVGGSFRFRDADPRAAWERWVRAGVNHHSACSPGDLGEAVATVAARLGIGQVRVC
jgi:L-arabinose isomerase